MVLDLVSRDFVSAEGRYTTSPDLTLGGSFGGNPLAQRLGTDTQLPGDFGDRAAGVDDQSGSLVLVLGAEGSPGSSAGGLPGTGDILSCGTGPAKSGVHSTRVGPDGVYFCVI